MRIASQGVHLSLVAPTVPHPSLWYSCLTCPYSNGNCLPACSDGCGHGVCLAPDTCSCELGYVGDTCSSKCNCNGHSTCLGPESLDLCTDCQHNTTVSCRKVLGKANNIGFTLIVKQLDCLLLLAAQTHTVDFHVQFLKRNGNRYRVTVN